MLEPPGLDKIELKVMEIFVETLDPDKEVAMGRPLIAELGFDSLDMIELSFALEEFFGFEFSSRNAIEELERAVGGNRILTSEGLLTEAGREAVLERMPELSRVELPERLSASVLPSYFTLTTFARILHDFYRGAPDHSEGGERVVFRDFTLVAGDSGESIDAPTGDELLERWLETKSAELSTAAR